MSSKSTFEEERLKFQPALPLSLREIKAVEVVEGKSTTSKRDVEKLKSLFPKTFGQSILHFKMGEAKTSTPLRVGVLFSGGQAPGGHNVVIGLFDALKKWHPRSSLFGFVGGPSGLIHGKYEELDESSLAPYRNTGGFDLIGAGRTKIESDEQLETSFSVLTVTSSLHTSTAPTKSL